MYSSIIKITLVVLVLGVNVSWALDTSSEENTCAEIGFKRKTEPFANCVLELVRRKSNKAPVSAAPPPVVSSNPDDAICLNNGYKPGTNEFTQCRLQINNAKAQAAKEAQDQKEAAAYRELGAVGARMMASPSPYFFQGLGAALNGQVAPGPPPMDMSGPRIYNLPGGKTLNCTTMGNVTNCN